MHVNTSVMRRRFKLISIEEAQANLYNAVKIKPSMEKVAISEAVGRVLAENIVSPVDIPERNIAVFDGYILHPEDVQEASKEHPIRLDVVSRLFPGDNVIKISRGQAIFTATGGPVPAGPYALIKVENTRRFETQIEMRFPVKPGKNVALAGEDVKKDSAVLCQGHILRPQDIGLLAGFEMKTVQVFNRPTVAILSVGDELVTLNSNSRTGNKIVNNYAFIVSRLVSEFGGNPQHYGVVEDDVEKIKKTLKKATNESDLVLTIAGCSVGPKDLVPDAITSLGRLVFHGLRLSPGKVIGAGIIHDTPTIMLPGHIVSTFAGFYLFVVPMLATYRNLRAENVLSTVKARLASDPKKKSLPYFMRLNLKQSDKGIEAVPVGGGSSRLNTLVGSNGFYIVPARKELKEGDEIDVVLYGPLEFAHMHSKIRD